jgi:hypothetical protein
MTEHLHDLRDELDLEMIERSIRKYAMGSHVWWQVYPAVQQEIEIVGMGPEGPIGQAVAKPAWQIVLGIPGSILGKEHYIWHFVALFVFPTEELLDKPMNDAFTTMRERKAQQANGINPAQGGITS